MCETGIFICRGGSSHSTVSLADFITRRSAPVAVHIQNSSDFYSFFYGSERPKPPRDEFMAVFDSSHPDAGE